MTTRYKLKKYFIREEDSNLFISDSRSTVYDVLEVKNEGYELYQISEIFNLTPMQVQAALDYIELHEERLQSILKEIIRQAEERKKYHDAIAAEIRAKIAAEPMTPERQKLQEIRARIRAEQELHASYSQ